MGSDVALPRWVVGAGRGGGRGQAKWLPQLGSCGPRPFLRRAHSRTPSGALRPWGFLSSVPEQTSALSQDLQETGPS